MLNKLLMVTGGILVALVCYIAVADGDKINKERRMKQLTQELAANASRGGAVAGGAANAGVAQNQQNAGVAQNANAAAQQNRAQNVAQNTQNADMARQNASTSSARQNATSAAQNPAQNIAQNPAQNAGLAPQNIAQNQQNTARPYASITSNQSASEPAAQTPQTTQTRQNVAQNSVRGTAGQGVRVGSNSVMGAVSGDGSVDFKQALRGGSSAGTRVLTNKSQTAQTTREPAAQTKPATQNKTTAQAKPKPAAQTQQASRPQTATKPKPATQPQQATQPRQQTQAQTAERPTTREQGGGYGAAYSSSGSGVRVNSVRTEGNKVILDFGGEFRRDYVSFRQSSNERVYTLKNVALSAPFSQVMSDGVTVSVRRASSNSATVSFTHGGSAKFMHRVTGKRLEFTVR